jgi:hypothetical protein
MRLLMLSVVSFTTISLSARAADLLPHDAQPLSVILVAAEKAGMVPVDVRVRNGIWEVRGGQGREGAAFDIDPRTAAILGQRSAIVRSAPPPGGAAPSTLIRQIELAGFQPVTRLTWTGESWLVVAMSGNQSGEFRVSAEGQILAGAALR